MSHNSLHHNQSFKYINILRSSTLYSHLHSSCFPNLLIIIDMINLVKIQLEFPSKYLFLIIIIIHVFVITTLTVLENANPEVKLLMIKEEETKVQQ